LGYGAADLSTLLSTGTDPAQKPVTVYLRKEFVVNDPVSTIKNLRLEALYDDGFVLYLNGREVVRSASMPGGAVSHSTTTTTSYNSIGYETFDLSASANLLQVGHNVLCVEVHQESPSSDDLLWDASLSFDVEFQPTLAAPTITPGGGSFPGPVQVSIEAAPVDATVYHTTDGTEPDQTSPLYKGAFMLSSSAEVRARAYKPGYNESAIVTAKFLVGVPGFLEVSSSAGLVASGTIGGPFIPSSITYALTNSGRAPVSWAATTSQDWVSLSATGGTLEASTSTSLTVFINTNANMLPAGTYSDTVAFWDSGTGAQSISRPITIDIAPSSFSLQVALLGSGDVQITLRGQPLASYVIETSTDLTHWTPILTETTPANGSITYVGASTDGSQRFYRGLANVP
jgi:hypothetical protein